MATVILRLREIGENIRIVPITVNVVSMHAMISRAAGPTSRLRKACISGYARTSHHARLCGVCMCENVVA